MIYRVQNIWKPENFHYHGRLRSKKTYFEGWYYKIVDRDQKHPHAIIPGIMTGSDAHAFVQILDGAAGVSNYHHFPVDTFQAEKKRFDFRLRKNRFHADGFALSIEAKDQTIIGEINFKETMPWPVRFLSPGCMGPFAFAPFMECYHAIPSLYHNLAGVLHINGREIDFSGGRGYLEKDWGRGFPEAYVWAHSNHFAEEGVCITASVAKIPWLTGAFRGFLIGFLVDGKLHRFTTYVGAKIDKLTLTEKRMSLIVRNRDFRLELLANKSRGAVLRAPYEKQMLERVAETMTSKIDVELTEIKTNRRLFSGTGTTGCLEINGKLEEILD